MKTDRSLAHRYRGMARPLSPSEHRQYVALATILVLVLLLAWGVWA